jgi:GTP-binding protein LepA
MNIRNFSIIAHIDAGKSTLADRILEKTGTVSSRNMQDQFLDQNPIERERGITIKMAPVTMNYKGITLNLIDTPGHVDFNYEVERALQACEGAVLLIDATKGIQAQTISNLLLAQKLNLKIISAINKIDANLADVSSCQKQIENLLPGNIPLLISAKTGEGIDMLLKKIIEEIPKPQSSIDYNQTLQIGGQALIFNSVYHPHLGAIAFVRIVSGVFIKDQPLHLIASKLGFTPVEIGIFSPDRIPQKELSAGQVGYIITGLKDISKVRVGDTITFKNQQSITPALPGFRKIMPNVYFDVFPTDATQFLDLVDALEKLKLNDAALITQNINSPVLGQGVKVGFLGLLHAEVISERLNREFDLEVITTSPGVNYKIKLKNGKEEIISSPADYPDPSLIDKTYEPIAKIDIIVTENFIGSVMGACENLRGSLINMTYLDKLVRLEYDMPLIEVISRLHDSIKSVSSGFASVNYQLKEYQETKLVKIEVLLNKNNYPPLSILTTQQQAQQKAVKLAAKLKEAIPRQQFEVPIQIAIGGKVIARETIKAFRKDVTAKLYGGDSTRRKKLLEKQKKGKSRMKQFGTVNLPQEVFLASARI